MAIVLPVFVTLGMRVGFASVGRRVDAVVVVLGELGREETGVGRIELFG
jgi:hypothetical protein